MAPTREELLAALNRLGLHPAATLRRLGIRGVRGSACECPVARYVRREFELDARDVAASSGEVMAAGVYAVPPEPVARLVRTFDRDAHRELEESTR